MDGMNHADHAQHMQPMQPLQHMQHGTGDPGFFALWSPAVLLIAVLLGVLYFYAVGPWRRYFSHAEPVGKGRKWSMVVGLLLFYIGQGSPINYYGHTQSFSMHMLQQSIVYLTVPIFIWSALPAWLLRPFLDRRGIRAWLHPLTHPLLAVLLFNMLFSVYHFPLVMNTLHEHPWALGLYHFALYVSAFHMWFPVFGALPDWSRLTDLRKIAYIFANGVLLTPACALIIFASETMYPMYAQAAPLFAGLTPLDEQQLGGTIMKILQELIYGVCLAVIFFSWYRVEKARDDELSDEPAPDAEHAFRASRLHEA